MRTSSLVIIALGAGLAVAPNLAANPQQAAEQPQGARPEQVQVKREYHFRTEDQPRLREYYVTNFREHDRIEVAKRPRLVIGARLTGDWKASIHPVPEVVYRELPAVP